MDLNNILGAIDQIETRNNQSISFIIHGDGSCCFQDFWDESMVEFEGTKLQFENLNELETFIEQL